MKSPFGSPEPSPYLVRATAAEGGGWIGPQGSSRLTETNGLKAAFLDAWWKYFEG